MSTVEGVFAINKPPAITSAQVLRNLQEHFKPSQLFAPWIARERALRAAESKNQKRRRRDKTLNVKLGHGGTLDPLATGVLIVGVGSGTKALPNFLGCTKTYETVVLFGASSDTYDTEGKVVARASYDHLTKDTVEKALARFRGKVMQIPPLWSAIRVEGKHMYEYAREGKEPPRKLVERSMETSEVTLLDWLPGGSHQWNWPREEAPTEEREAAAKLLHQEETAGKPAQITYSGQKREAEDESNSDIPAKKAKRNDGNRGEDLAPTKGTASLEPSTSSTEEQRCPAPAARIRLSVSSGFYVRSFAHDLGQAVGSLALMASLVRSRQAGFELPRECKSKYLEDKNIEASDGAESIKEDAGTRKGDDERLSVLEYADFAEGEERWGPKVEAMLKAWNDRETGVNTKGRPQQLRNTSSPDSE
ncbi:MAG: hypothetical protein Q9160_008062 [Pyrenula sp. 1 TL-2023]